MLWSVGDNHWKVEKKIELHQKKIKDATYSLWGVNFSVKKDKFKFPLRGFMHVRGTWQVHYEARVIDIVQTPDINHIPEESLEFEYKTYLVLDKLEKLSRPIPTKEFKIISNNVFVKKPPQSQYYVEPPDLVDEKEVKS